MSLLDRLRPKWQNTDPEVRAEAVKSLDRNETELLTSVAIEDPEIRIRRMAIKKLDAPRLLLDVAERNDDPSVKQFARARARQLLVRIACDDRDAGESKRALALLSDGFDLATVADKARFSEVRDEAFSAIVDDDSLARLVLKSRNPELRTAALERIESPSTLKTIAVKDVAGDVALVALGKLEDIRCLEAIAAHRGASRSVRRNAYLKLSQIVPSDHPIKTRAREKKLEKICRSAERLATTLVGVTSSELEALERDWSATEAEGAAPSKLVARFRESVARVREFLIKWERARASAEPQHAVAPTASRPSPGIEIPADLVTESVPNGEMEPSQTEGSAPRDRSDNNHLTGALESLVEQAEATSQQDNLDEASKAFALLEEEWTPLAKDASREIVGRFRDAQEVLETRRRSQRRERETARAAETLSELETRIDRLNELAKGDEVEIRRAEKELHEAQDFLKTMGPLPKSVNRRKLRRRLIEARELLFKKTQETRGNEEWKRWANSDIQESLIRRTEALLESKDFPKVARELRSIHEEWKRAGSAEPDRADELWQRYKSARDELKSRCNVYFEQQIQERSGNVEKKQALIERVEALKDSEDWLRTADTIKEIQKEWKGIGPLPPQVSDEMWGRFRAACDHFFARRKEDLGRLKAERESNLQKKQALCERAEALKDSTDWQAVATEIRRLQVEWRGIGAVPKKKSDAIWKRFRGACDHFFERYKRRSQVDEEELSRGREGLVEELLALHVAEDPEAATKAQDIWQRWKKLGGSYDSLAEASIRFEAGMHALISREPQAFRGTELDPEVNRAKREKLVQRLENIVSELDPSSPAQLQIDGLAERLKNALANNTMTGGRGRDRAHDLRTAGDEVARLRSNWLRSAPFGGEEGRRLRERFESAYRSFLDLGEGASRARSAGADNARA
ncbi:MAG TPA: DUF349 domain-containing protein [Vicinamibacteria bacterium]|nr:DUF349 domain-containing protein [Vicinamibacteria bacterium]